MKVGGSYKYIITNMVFNNNTVNWVDSVKYLGITFRGGARLSVECADMKHKFYVACNSVHGCCKYADECVKVLSLVKNVPTYADVLLGALDTSSHIVYLNDLTVCGIIVLLNF